jgi:hypothetical protein
MHKIVVFVPDGHQEKVKTAMFAAGGGKIGAYDCCSFELQGAGQFRALEGSNPFLGKHGEVETVTELRVEMVCEDHCLKDVLQAMKKNHPYETPAFDVIKLENITF